VVASSLFVYRLSGSTLSSERPRRRRGSWEPRTADHDSTRRRYHRRSRGRYIDGQREQTLKEALPKLKLAAISIIGSVDLFRAPGTSINRPYRRRSRPLQKPRAEAFAGEPCCIAG
jgi:hypothetical protein